MQGTVTAFNGTNKTYLLYVVPEISSPLVDPGQAEGHERARLRVPLVPTLPGQPNATLTYFEVNDGRHGHKKKGGKKKKINYLENPTKCPSGGYPWKFDVQVRERRDADRRPTTRSCKKYVTES